MTLQNELYMFFRRLPRRNLLVDTLLSRWELIGHIRKAMTTLSIGLFIASQSRNYELGAKYIDLLNLAIKAHVYVVSLPAIISINADDIYRQPVLHQYYLQFPKYRDHHQEIRELILKEKYIRDNVKGITALVEYYGIQELHDKIAWFAESPAQLPIAVSTFIVRSVLRFLDDTFRVINYITSVFRADDPDLLKHIVSVKILRAANVMHDADFTMQASMIYQWDTYRHVFAEIQREERPRPFLHYGTSRFTATPERQSEKTIVEYLQPLERELFFKVPKPFTTTTYAFEHEGVQLEHRYAVHQFGQVVKRAPSPGERPSGIGGTTELIWLCDHIADRVYELSPTDLSAIRSAPSPGTGAGGIGGDEKVIWHTDFICEKVYELSTTDFSVVKTAPSPGPDPGGIGGDEKAIWHCDWSFLMLYELSTTDFSVIRSATSVNGSPTGIGGTVEVIWHCDGDAVKIYELSSTDFSVIRSAPAPDPGTGGTGGNEKVIWHCNWRAKKVYKIRTQ